MSMSKFLTTNVYLFTAAQMTLTVFFFHLTLATCFCFAAELAVVHVLAPLLDFAQPHRVIFAWTPNNLHSFGNWEDEFGRASGTTAGLSLCNPRFVLTNLVTANWIIQQMFLCCFFCPKMLPDHNLTKSLCACNNCIGFLDLRVYTLYCTRSVYSKVNRPVSRTCWTWLAGTITMRCLYNGRAPIPDLPIYLAVLMSAY